MLSFISMSFILVLITNCRTCGFVKCFADATEKSLFYNRTLSETLKSHSSWNAATGELASLQTPEDVQPFLQVQEKLISHCIARSKLSDSKYHGTAAISRDIAALADALDGLGSPINLWTESYGSILASYVMKRTFCQCSSRHSCARG